MVLSDKFIERPWTNARREGSRRADALQVFRLAFGDLIVHRVKMYGEGSLGASVNMCATVVARIGDAGLARARKCGSEDEEERSSSGMACALFKLAKST